MSVNPSEFSGDSKDVLVYLARPIDASVSTRTSVGDELLSVIPSFPKHFGSQTICIASHFTSSIFDNSALLGVVRGTGHCSVGCHIQWLVDSELFNALR